MFFTILFFTNDLADEYDLGVRFSLSSRRFLFFFRKLLYITSSMKSTIKRRDPFNDSCLTGVGDFFGLAEKDSLRLADPGLRLADPGLRLADPGLAEKDSLRLADPGLSLADPGLSLADPGLAEKDSLRLADPALLGVRGDIEGATEDTLENLREETLEEPLEEPLEELGENSALLAEPTLELGDGEGLLRLNSESTNI
jgi:hypothetical protein